jgi:hypothetical protein
VVRRAIWSHSHIFVNAPYFDALRVDSEESMVTVSQLIIDGIDDLSSSINGYSLIAEMNESIAFYMLCQFLPICKIVQIIMD